MVAHINFFVVYFNRKWVLLFPECIDPVVLNMFLCPKLRENGSIVVAVLIGKGILRVNLDLTNFLFDRLFFVLIVLQLISSDKLYQRRLTLLLNVLSWVFFSKNFVKVLIKQMFTLYDCLAGLFELELLLGVVLYVSFDFSDGKGLYFGFQIL